MPDIEILHLIEGARKAEGLVVIIDVFRAFSLECYLYSMGAKEIRPVGTIEDAFLLRDRIAESVLVGERHGRKCDGFDYGNSPSSINAQEVLGRTVVHTTSAGTQGIINAVKASKIITGSLVNAKAIAEYIVKMQPQKVSLVCMGNEGVLPAKEDELCAEYIEALLLGNKDFDLKTRIEALKIHGGSHFFDESNQDVFPKEDFYMCIEHDKFPFVIEIDKDDLGFVAKKKIISMDYSKYDGLSGTDFLVQFFKDNGVSDEEILYYDAWDCFYNCEKLRNDEKGIEYAKSRVQAIIDYRNMTLESLREDYDAAPWAWKFKEFVSVPFVNKNEIKPGSRSIFLCFYNQKLFFFNVGKEEPTGVELDDMILKGKWSVYTFAM